MEEERETSETIEAEDKKFNKKLGRFSINTILVIASIMLIFLFIASLLYTAYFKNTWVGAYNEGIYYEKDNIILNLFYCLIFISAIYGISKIFKKVNLKIVSVISIIIVGIMCFVWINFVQAPVKSDQNQVLICAKEFAKNRFGLLEGNGYFYMHPLQLGCVLGMELIVRIIHTYSWIAMQRVNILFLIGIVYLLMKIAKKTYKSDSTNKILNLLLISSFIIPLFSIVVYGNIYGLLFALLAVFLLMKYYENRKIRYIILIPVSLSISIILKSNYEIVIIAIVISLILDLINKFNWKTVITIPLILVMFSVSYPLVYKFVEYRSGIEINDGIPMIAYVAMSIQEPVETRNSGWYHDGKNVEMLYPENNFDAEATSQASKQIIKQRLKEFRNSPEKIREFYIDKIASTWIEPAFQTLWWAEPAEEFKNLEENNPEYIEYLSNNGVLLDIFHGERQMKLLKYLDVVEITVFAMSLLSVLVSIKNNTLDYKKITLLLIFVGGFLFHIIWETKCIYVIPYYIMLLPSSADGIDKLGNTIINIFIKIKDKIKNNLLIKKNA